MNWFRRKRKETGFVCTTCGQIHENTPTDIGHSLPDAVWALGEEARNKHLQWSTDLSYFEGKSYLRGVLQVPFTFREGKFAWGVWAEVSEETIRKYQKIFDHDGSSCPRESGSLANEIVGIESTIGLPIEVQFGPSDQRPTLFFHSNCSHPLAIIQRTGLGEAQYHAIIAPYLRP